MLHGTCRYGMEKCSGLRRVRVSQQYSNSSSINSTVVVTTVVVAIEIGSYQQVGPSTCLRHFLISYRFGTCCCCTTRTVQRGCSTWHKRGSFSLVLGGWVAQEKFKMRVSYVTARCGVRLTVGHYNSSSAACCILEVESADTSAEEHS